MEHDLVMDTARPPRKPSETLREEGQMAVAALLVTLNCGEEEDQRDAMEMLELVAENTASIIDVLIETLTEENDGTTKTVACRVIERLGKIAWASIPALVVLLDDPRWKVREAAMLALAPMGRLARSASPYLAKIACDDKYPALRDMATDTLNKFNKPT